MTDRFSSDTLTVELFVVEKDKQKGICMKKIYFPLIILIALFLLISCAEEGSSCTYPFSSVSLTLGTTFEDTIPSFGTNYYSFQAPTEGSYNISLTNLTSSCSWELYEYISDCGDDYIAADSSSIASGWADDIVTVNPLYSGKYLLVVDEWEDLGAASYTVLVIQN